MEKSRKSVRLAGMTAALLVVQQVASRLGSKIADWFDYEAVDPYGLFARISVHHVVQMVAGLLLILVLGRVLKQDFYLQAGDTKRGLHAVALFSAIVLGYTIGGYTIHLFTGGPPTYDFPLNMRNVTGTLGFQLLLSGPSEEILFRALPITLLCFAAGESTPLGGGKFSVSIETVIAALLFSFAHTDLTFSPFSMSANPLQLVYSFVLGVAYGKVYQETRSVLYPMLMHSASNVFMVGMGYLLSLKIILM